MAEKAQIKCSACGSSPVNHILMFSLRLVDEIVGRIAYIFSPFSFLSDNTRLADFFEKILFNILYCLGVVRYSGDIEKVKNGRSKLIWEEATRRGIEIRQVLFWGKPLDHFRAKVNGRIIFFNSLPIPPWLSHKGYRWIDDKLVFAKKLEAKEIPSPKTRKILSWKDALRAFESLEKPIIIKPKLGSLGRHTTTNINTKEELRKAFDLARQITFSMVAQEHLFGSVYRATVVNNVLVGFFRGDPPFVLGDGVKNIKELILEKNQHKPERVSDILINEELLNFLKREDYTIESIPLVGTHVNLLAKTGRFYGGYTKEMLPEVHPKFHSIFKKASELVSVPVAGFDLIIGDPTKDPDTQRWGIIECNSLPFIDLHYFALEGEPVNVAKYIWDLWNVV
jgi:D-alanine-D-alanine ligase-like ATP-grasp enzyme